MPEIDSVKLDVYDSNRNSLTSMANAIKAPAVTLHAKTIASDAMVSDDKLANCNSASPDNQTN